MNGSKKDVICVILLVGLFKITPVFSQLTGDPYTDAFNFGYDMIMDEALRAFEEAERQAAGSGGERTYNTAFNTMLAIAAYGYFMIDDLSAADAAAFRNADEDGDGLFYDFQNGSTETFYSITNWKTRKILICVLSNDASMGNRPDSEIRIYNLYNANQKKAFITAYNAAKAGVERR
jgi:hypothetical protein